MTRVPGKMTVLMRLRHTLHHILNVYYWGLTGFMCAGHGSTGLDCSDSPLLLNKVGTQRHQGVFVVCSLLALLLSPSVFLLRCVSPSMIDVSL